MNMRIGSVSVKNSIATAVCLAMTMQTGFGTATVRSAPSARAQSLLDVVTSHDKVQHNLGRVLAGPLSANLKATAADRRRYLQEAFALLRQVEREIPRDTFDLASVSRELGATPGRVHAWVREQTRPLAYRGVLRGARGVLMDRFGNSLDRSLLALELLKVQGVEARLARARMSDDGAQALLAESHRLLSDVLRPQPPLASLGEAAVQDYAARAGIDLAILNAGVRDATRLASETVAQVRSLTRQQASALMSALSLPDEAGDGPALEAVRDHWWVQWREAGTWRDLDPFAPAVGQALAVAQETRSPDEIEPALYHQVRLDVVAERTDDDSIVTVRPLSHTFRVEQVMGKSITLRHVGLTWPRTLGVELGAGQRSAFEKAVQESEWIPILTIDGKHIAKASITESGLLNEAPGPQSKRPPPAIDSMLGALGGESEEPRTAGVFSAAWIEYQIIVPGESTRTIDRDVFDLVGAAARAAGQRLRTLTDADRRRRGLALMGQTELLALSSELSPAYVAHLAVSRMLANQADLEKAAGSDGLSATVFHEQLEKLSLMPSRLYRLALARSQWREDASRARLAAPNVLSRHVYPAARPDGTLLFGEAFDIVASEVDAAGAGRLSVRERVEQGVLDAIAEVAVLGTADAEHGALGAPESLKVLRSSQDVEALDASPDMKRRIARDVAAGYRVLVSPGSQTQSRASVGWWRVHPRRGDTVWIGDRGWGQAQAEYLMAQTFIFIYGTFRICTTISGSDRNGLTVKDQLTCALAVLGGAAAVFAAGYALAAVAFATAGVLGTAIGNVDGSLDVAGW